VPRREPSAHIRTEAAAIIRRVVDVLPMPPRVEAYLRGHADGLDPKTK
jgi:hypothetical protein